MYRQKNRFVAQIDLLRLENEKKQPMNNINSVNSVTHLV